ncbi:hypothetical protein [Streptomyces sp. 372A]
MLRGLRDLREARLAEVPAEATGAALDDIAVRTAAALLGSVHRMVFDRLQELTLAGWTNARIRDEPAASGDYAFGMLEEPLDGYAAGSPRARRSTRASCSDGCPSRPGAPQCPGQAMSSTARKGSPASAAGVAPVNAMTSRCRCDWSA